LYVNESSTYHWPTGISLDLELPTWGMPGWDNGDEVEGRVAGALWDIYDSVDDSVDDGWDECSEGFDEIWEAFSTQTDNTFREFWDALKEEFLDDIPPARSIFQNTILYAPYSELPGDANEDDVVNVLDLTKVVRIILQMDNPTPGADANEDEAINVLDLTEIARIIMGLP